MKRQRFGKGSAALLLIALLLAPTLLAPLSHAQGTESQFAKKLWEILMAQNEVWKGTGLFVNVARERTVEIPRSASALDKMTKVAERLKASGFLTEDQFKDVLKYLASDRRYDIAGHMKTLKVDFSRRLICIETKTAIENKAHVVAELIRDMYLAYTDPEKVGKIVYVYPAHDKNVRDWVMEMVETVGSAFQEEFGVKGGGALGEKALVVYASDQYFLDWTGIGGQTMYRFLSIAGTVALYVLYVATMSAVLVNAPPNTVLASVGYSGYGSGGTIVVVVYFDLKGGYSDEQAFITDIHVGLEVNGTRFTLAQFPLPVWVRSGGALLEPEPFVIPSSAAPTPPVQLPTAPWLSYDGQKLHFEVPLKRYTVRVTQPDGTVVVKDVMDVFVLDADVNRAEIGLASVKTYETKSASVVQVLVNQWVDRAPSPPSQVTSVNPAPTTPYVTVKVSVASGCGFATVVPQLWFYPSGPEVSVPNGSLVVLRAYPCDGCSLRYWQLSDGQRTWTVTGTYVGLRVNRSLTAVAYFTDPPKQPKLVLRAESSDGAPVYVNMSGWVLWYSGAVYNTTLSNALFRSLDFSLRHDTPLGFKMTANKTAVWVGVPAVGYGSYSLSLDLQNTASGCTYATPDSGSYATISGLHLLLVQAKGDRATVNTKGGSVSVGDCKPTTCAEWNCYWIGLTQFCECKKYAGSTARVLDWCVFTSTYNFNNAKPEVSEQVCGWISGTYSVAKKTQLKFLRWELRGPEGVIARWYGPEAHLPAWYNSTSYRWEGEFYPPYSKPDATYELVAIYGPPQATLTAKVSAVLPDGSRVYLSSVMVNATTAGASASALTNGSGIAQLKLPTGSPVALAFPRIINYAPYRLVVENVTYNGARLGALTYVNDTASAILPTFDKDGTVEIAYRAVAPLAVSWGPGGSVLPGFRQVANGTAVYAEDGMPVALVTKPASGYRFSRWVIVEKPWIGQPVSKGGSGRAGARYTGAWSVTVNVEAQPVDWAYVYIYVEAVDARGRVRQLAYREVYLWYSRERATVTWTGVLYNEDVQVRVTNDRGLVYLSVSWSVSPATYVFTGERASGGGYVKNAAAMTQHRFEGPVRVSVNFTTNPIASNYQWRLRLLAVGADGSERELFATGWYTGSTRSLSLTWTGSLKDEWVKAVVESNDDCSYKSLSVYAEPLLPANATVLYRWPVQLKAEFARG